MVHFPFLYTRLIFDKADASPVMKFRGSVTLLQCAAYNFTSLLVCRMLMGTFEAGFMGIHMNI